MILSPLRLGYSKRTFLIFVKNVHIIKITSRLNMKKNQKLIRQDLFKELIQFYKACEKLKSNKALSKEAEGVIEKHFTKAMKIITDFKINDFNASKNKGRPKNKKGREYFSEKISTYQRENLTLDFPKKEDFLEELQNDNINFVYVFAYSPLLTVVRNELLTWGGSTNLFNNDIVPRKVMFIDSDIGFNPNDVIALLAMMSDDSPYDIMGGPYPKKAIKWKSIATAMKKNPNIDSTT